MARLVQRRTVKSGTANTYVPGSVRLATVTETLTFRSDSLAVTPKSLGKVIDNLTDTWGGSSENGTGGVGPQGPIGPQGVQGATGATGPQGPAGSGSSGGSVGTRITQSLDLSTSETNRLPSELLYTLEPNSIYSFEFMFKHSSQSSSFPMDLLFTYPTASTIMGQVFNQRTSVSGEVVSFDRFEDIKMTAIASSTKTMVSSMKGEISTGSSAGVFRLDIASKQIGQTVSLKKGSSLTIVKL